jgi:hypothetical protein
MTTATGPRTAYAINAQTALDELHAYIKEAGLDPEDWFIQTEIERHEKELALSLAQPTVIIETSGTPEAVEAYLGFGAAICGESPTLICMPAEHAQWMVMRLGSGLFGANVIN